MSLTTASAALLEFRNAASANGAICAAPLDDTVLYRALCDELLTSAVLQEDPDALLVLDVQTAMILQSRATGLPQRIRVIIAGPAEGDGRGTNFGLASEAITDDLRFVFLLTPAISVAVAGQELSPEGLHSFSGIWTVHRPSVVDLIGRLTGPAGRDLVAEAGPAEVVGEEIARTAMRLMDVLASQLTVRERVLARDKADLSSVLNILKAISARRRTHDILFVFVEQVARVVQCDRCSIVRVWDDQQMGHVLASHEDESVYDRTIDMVKYPELQESIVSQRKVVVDDVRSHPLTQSCAQQLTQAHIHSLVVIPIVLRDEEVGTLVLRAARSTMRFSPQEVSFFEIVAEAAANALERAHLFDSIQRANARLERLAVTDDLTNLFNHRYLRDRMEEEYQRSMRYRLPLSCMIFDVDDFKKVNDTYGHLHGDRVLQEIARRTAHSVRRSDTVARYGGEEFIVIMPQTNEEGAMTQAERIRQEIAAEPVRAGASLIPVTVSVGVAVLNADTMVDTEALLRAADQALYRSKRNGKNRVTLHKEESTQ
ncbi:MAG: sensor domain-containing diguanylate cyclase [Candidatus Hydrogenedentes bacterium]|nr:sensor domain-containing diguanylate cyclase [Candidatus Hydrogenedentota bacterium]